MERILITNATVVSDPLKGEFHRDTGIMIERTEIAALGPVVELEASHPRATRIDARGMLLLPGLIDAHTHLYSALILAMPAMDRPPQNFPEVLSRIWWRWDKVLSDDDVYASALVGSIASLRSGITTIIDHHASPTRVPGSLSRIASAVDECGLRACLAYEVSDRDGTVSRDQGIAENRRFIQETKRRGGDRLKALFGLHAVFSLSDETLHRCAEETADLGVGCHMHVAEHLTEVQKFARDHPQSIVQFLADTGILGPQTLLAHTVHISDEDIELLRATETFNVHNPRSNMGNGVGIAPVAKAVAMSQPTGLGSDGFFDMPQEIVLARLLQTLNSGNPSAFSDHDALTLAYSHNVRFAEKVFGCRLGKIAPGYKADLVMVGYEPTTPLEGANLSSHIVSALTGGQINAVLVDGKLVLHDGEVVGVDAARALALAHGSAKRLAERLG